ncbi:MAG: hypothetical protein AABX02_01225, partial [archaeon]
LGNKGLSLTNFIMSGEGADSWTYSFDMRNGMVYINPNYEEGYQEVGSDRTLTENDIPADDVIIAVADAFLREQGISRDGYGAPAVDKSLQYMIMSARAEATTSAFPAYVSHVVNVNYPILVPGNAPVADTGGNSYGMSIQVNVVNKRVAGASNIMTKRFEQSAYDLETDTARLIRVAERGGMNGGWLMGTGGILTLGEPTLTYMQYTQYNESERKSIELYIPAFKFPITNLALDRYQGSRAIMVPLVKDVLTQLEQNWDNMPKPIEGDGGIGGGEVMPMDAGMEKPLRLK